MEVNISRSDLSRSATWELCLHLTPQCDILFSIKTNLRPMKHTGGWVAGIVGTVIAGYLVWWLTFMPDVRSPRPVPRPDLKAVNSKISLNKNGPNLEGSFSLFNQGNTTAENCTVTLTAKEIDATGKNRPAGVPPQREKVFNLVVYHLNKWSSNSLYLEAKVNCSNFSATIYSNKWQYNG